MQESFIELHDSVVESIARQGSEVVVLFSHAYIHRWTGKPGARAGTGWSQAAELRFESGEMPDSLPELPEYLFRGHLQLGEQVLKNEIPIPLEDADEAELVMVFAPHGTEVVVKGARANLLLLGEAEYVEDIPWED